MAGQLLLAGLLITLTGCFPKADAESRSGNLQTQVEPASVNLAIARVGNLETDQEYTGTTQPLREVSLRSQVSAQLLSLTVDVGDAVTQGQPLARLDSGVQTASLAEARAEVAARDAEVADAQVLVSDARTQVNRAQAELQQSRSDLSRQEYLYRQGAIPAQQVEQARTRVDTALATLRSTQEQVRSRQQKVVAAQGRVEAQQAVVAQEQQQQSFTVLTSPVTGFVLERVSEPGNVLQVGGEVLRLGDFSQIKVAVQVSELELNSIRLGQTVQVRLDAFPNRTFTGRVSRISPAADPVARLVPIEVTLPNPQRQIGSGLLARVTFQQRSNRSRVVVPETTLQANQDRRGGQTGGDRPNQPQGDQPQSGRNNLPRDIGTLFVVADTRNETRVTARQVTLGKRADGQVEIISGLTAGDRYVTRSSKALKNGDLVRPSILSERGKERIADEG